MMSLYPSMKQGVATCMGWDYSALAGANSPAGRRNPSISRRISAPSPLRGVFLRLTQCSMVAVCGQASAWPGAYCPGIPTSHTVAAQSRRKDGSGSISVGATPMRHTLTLSPSKARAAAYKAMAFAALHANSSLSVRLARYNAHMTKARSLGGAQ